MFNHFIKGYLTNSDNTECSILPVSVLLNKKDDLKNFFLIILTFVTNSMEIYNGLN